MRRLAVSFTIFISAALIAEDAPLKGGLLASYRDNAHQVDLVVPTPHFSLNLKESLHPSLAPEFKAEWKGVIKILRRGEYRFFAEAGAVVKINGNDALARQLELKGGEHDFEISYERKPGNARLQLRWQSDLFGLEPIPSTVFFHRTEPAQFLAGVAIERGRELVEELNCVGCHATDLKTLNARRGPDLSGAGSRVEMNWIYKWLENPRHFREQAVMPALLTEPERRDVATYLSQLKAAKDEKRSKNASPQWIAEGKQHFEEVGCLSCHSKIGLMGMGSKTDLPHLEKYLLDPLATDPSGRMPALLKKDEDGIASRIAAYLVQSRNPDFEAAFPAGNADNGEKLVQTRGCLNCHALNPDTNARMATLGKTLKDMGLKNVSAWRYTGPFDTKGDLKKSFPPEENVDLDAEYEIAAGKKANWLDGSSFLDGQRHLLFGSPENAAAYLYRTIEAERDMGISLMLGTDDTATIWVNGKKYFEHLAIRGMPEEKDKVNVPLKAGVNHLLFKVGNAGGPFEFYFNFGFPVHILKNELSGPPLVKLSGGRGCLAETPAANVPRYGLTTDKRADITAFLKSVVQQPDISAAPVYDFYHAANKFRCVACHELNHERPGGLLEAAPVLTGIGEKLRVNFLDSVINQRVRSRSWMKLRMPHFGKEAVLTLPMKIAAAAGETNADPASPPPPTLEQMRTGVTMIGKEQGGMGCIACHDFQGQKAIGDVRGIDMTVIASRIKPEWFRRWMRDPAKIQPGTAMPQYFVDYPPEKAEATTDLLWSMLALGRAMPAPAGLGDKTSKLLTVGDQPILVRGFFPASSLRSIGVGLPGYISYCFDADQCRLRYAWMGGFLDMAREWTDRGGGPPQPLGKAFYVGSVKTPLRIGKPDAEPQVVFRGYKLVKNYPLFQYDIDGVSVTEDIRAGDGMGIVRTFEIANADRDIYFIKGDEKNILYRSSAGNFEGNALKISAGKNLKFSITVLSEEKKP